MAHFDANRYKFLTEFAHTSLRVSRLSGTRQKSLISCWVRFFYSFGVIYPADAIRIKAKFAFRKLNYCVAKLTLRSAKCASHAFGEFYLATLKKLFSYEAELNNLALNEVQNLAYFFPRPEGTYRTEGISHTQYISHPQDISQIPSGIYIAAKLRFSHPKYHSRNSSFDIISALTSFNFSSNSAPLSVTMLSSNSADKLIEPADGNL